MRRLAFCIVLGIASTTFAQDHRGSGLASPAYLRLRAQHKIVQSVGVAALQNVAKPTVLELQGKVVGTCRAGDTTVLLFQRSDGETQEIEATALPEWLATSGDPVRILVRCARPENGRALKANLLGAAPEIDVLPVEEAYWRGLAAKRNAEIAAKQTKAKTSTQNLRSGLYGPIGSRGATSSRRDWILPASEVTPRYANFIHSHNPRLPIGQATQIAQAIVGFSLHYGVDARLVMAMLMVESGFDPNAVSRSGAIGLGQLMPGTARWMGVRNSYDTTDNLYGTVKLLRTHLNQYRTTDGSDLALTLAAYNAGSGAVARHGGVPPYRETQAYVRRVTAIFQKLRGY